MTKEELFSLVEKRRKELEIPYEKDPGYDYLKKFVDNNRIQTIEQFLKMDIWEFLKCLYYIRSERVYTIEEVSSMMDGFAPLFNYLSLSSLQALFDFLKSIVSNDKLDEIIDYFDTKDVIKLIHISDNDHDTYKILEQLKQIENKKLADIASFFKMLNTDSNLLLDVIDLYIVQLNMKQEIRFLSDRVSDLGINVRNRDKARFLDNWLRENYFINNLLGEVNEVANFVKQEEREEKKQKKLRYDELNSLNISINMLERELQNPEVRQARDIVKHISDLSIKKAVLELIMEYNATYFDELEKEYNYYNHNTKAHYQAVLNDYDISYDDYSLGQIMHHSVEDIIKMITVLEKMGIDKNKIFSILENSDFDSIMKINGYVNKGYINTSFLNRNVDIFYSDSDKFQVYEDNLKLLKSYTINPLNFSTCLYILFEDTSLLEKNLELCMSYGLLRHFQTTRDYRFLEDNNLVNKIDRILELGYEEFLEKDLGCLNSTHLKRLEVVKALNIPIDSLEEFQTILGDEKDFFISDEEIDYYIPNVLPYVSNEVQIPDNILSNYRGSFRTYNIDGILVSKLKVLRLLDEGKSMYEAITFGMNLSDDDYQKLMRSISIRNIR